MHLVTGYRRGSIYKIVSRYNKLGIDGLKDFRHEHRGPLLFNQVLADFAREFKLGQDKHIILTVDRAGWHTSKDKNIPEGLHLEYLQAVSPKLQPAERLWLLID